MMPAEATRLEADPNVDRLLSDLHRACLTPTWIYAPEFTPVEPPVSYPAHLWKWNMFREKLERAAHLIPIERGGDRRSMEVVNPNLRDRHATTHSIAAALQIVKPGESPPPHRHAAAAIRFFVEGEGAYTTVDFEKLTMTPGDLILTPAGTWHEHGNEGDAPVIWLDALDYPLVNLLQQGFFESYPSDHQQLRYPIGYTEHRIGLMRPTWEEPSKAIPRVTYRWSDTCVRLERLRDAEGSPFDGIHLEYVNPLTNGPVLPTLSCFIQMLRPNEHTNAHRESSSSVYFVFAGEGYSVIDGRRFDWARGDFFLTPPWSWHEHVNLSADDSIIFSISDKALLDAIGLYRSEPYAKDGGRQSVRDVFTPFTDQSRA